MKVEVNKENKQQDGVLPRLMSDKNGVIVLVTKKSDHGYYDVVHLSKEMLGVAVEGFHLYNSNNPFTDFEGSITLSND